MLKEYPPQQIEELYKTLPENLRDAVWSEKNEELITEVAAAHNIPEDKEDLLSRIVNRVLMGILPIQKFRATIQEELRIPEEQARAIAYAIRDKIFAPVADELRKLHGLEND